MKKKIIIAGGVIAVIMAVIVGILLFSPGFEMSINGQKVSSEEYLYVMNHQVYDVTQELTKGGSIQVNSEFWGQEIDGRIPYEVLADATIEMLKYNRAVYENAKELGYVDEIDYEHIVERMEAENESRADKIAKGEPVYGLSSFSIETYIEYETDSFQKAYCDDLDNEGMEITDEERQQYYEDNKDSLFVKEDDITLDYIEICYESEGLSEEQAKALKNELIAFYKEMGAEDPLKDMAEQHSTLSGYVKHEEILSEELSAKYRVMGEVLEYAYDLEAGETTQVIDENGCLYLIQCSERVEHDYLPLEDVKDYINKDLREQHYNELIEAKASEAVVEADKDVIYNFTKKYINN